MAHRFPLRQRASALQRRLHDNSRSLVLLAFALSAVGQFENWESEFLQMVAYVVLTACLFQRGSPESRDPDRPEADDAAAAVQAMRHGSPPAFVAKHPADAQFRHSQTGS